MCMDDGCDEVLCCLCAPLAAVFCCKVCKDKMGTNNVNQAPESAFFQQPDARISAAGIYGPQDDGPHPHNQAKFYPGGPQPNHPSRHEIFQGNHLPSQQNYARNGLPQGFVNQQPKPY